MDFSERLSRLIATLGMTQDEFAVFVGSDQACISRYLHDVAKPQLKTLVRICEASGCSLDWLCGFESSMFRCDAADAEFLDLFHGLPQARKETIVNLMTW